MVIADTVYFIMSEILRQGLCTIYINTDSSNICHFNMSIKI